MGMPWLPLFGDKTTEELEKELVKTEKKMAKLDETRIAIKVELALRKHGSDSED
jgi:hypothetical protein